ncbi:MULTISPECIES: glutathione S-transferase family protein [Hyphomicrobiales]|jgi:glutathione S-transferase|uniref:Glutathione S-transferase family protein n=2 Tax=Hyphomicrobiales TaxID=356 RepID=A0A546XF20_AGRTU|nr:MULTISPECIES: glutathione S-transferase family protein [Hyphomicrobiales]KAB2788686.1 glutathione S-transferase family protein [Brucella anthropi]MBE0563540.1 glutathione S-transferase family protein [Brucella anthropi]MBQ0708028.1 glutathione S-transferase family protein [Ochrobactrum sp. AP1BH01-1]TRA99320.1 glutathione S-transferase family protein [Agrobacterium tumefaciens]
MPTLYYAMGACSLAPHIALEWIGAPYEAARVQHGSSELLAVNPAGAVPTLREDDGWLLTQAGAILDYLAHKHPEAGLAGGDSLRARAEAHPWSSFFTSDVHAAFWPIFMPFRYTSDESESARQAVVEAGYKLVAKQLSILGRHLDGREYILNGARSMIDAYSFPMIRWALKLLPGGLEGYPNVLALHDRLAGDPAVQKVLAREAEGSLRKAERE